MKLLLFVLGSVLSAVPTNSSLDETTAAATNEGGQKVENSTVPVAIEPPKVLYVTPSILAVYGIDESVETEPPVILTRAEKEQIKTALKNLAASNQNQTVSEFTKSVWKSLKDKRQLAFSKWYFAHTLNLYMALEAVIPAAGNVSGDAFSILMGHCTCNPSPLFYKLTEICGKAEKCYVTAEEAHSASRILEKSAAALRFWPTFIARTTKGDMPLNHLKWYLDEAYYSLQNVVMINPELDIVIKGYNKLMDKLILPSEDEETKESKSEEKERSKKRRH